MPQKKLRHHLILSRDTGDQRLCNRIGQKVQLATPDQKSWSEMLPSLDDYLHAKNLRDCWISSNNIDDQRILNLFR